MLLQLHLYFDIGNDTLKCKNDTLIPYCKPGFNSYIWSDFNISNTTGQYVKVFPGIDTDYKVTAVSNTGCTATDSIKIQSIPGRHHSPW